MSLTSTSSDSEQVSLEDFLESCRAPTLLAELDDDEDMGEEEEENDEDENEDDADYEEVMVSRNLLSFMEEEGAAVGYESAGGRPSKQRRSWDDEYVLKRQFSALIPAFDPRPGRTNVNQTTGKKIQSKRRSVFRGLKNKVLMTALDLLIMWSLSHNLFY